MAVAHLEVARDKRPVVVALRDGASSVQGAQDDRRPDVPPWVPLAVRVAPLPLDDASYPAVVVRMAFVAEVVVHPSFPVAVDVEDLVREVQAPAAVAIAA